jgi:hypothetical protein
MPAPALLLACLLAQSAAERDPEHAEPVPLPPARLLPRAPLEGSPDGPNAVGVAARFAYRFNSDGNPAVGFSLGATFEHRYARLPPVLELGAALNLFFDRFSPADQIVNVEVQPQVTTRNTFALLQTAAARFGRARAWAGLGAGLSVGYGGAGTIVQAIARGGGGLELALRGGAAVGAHADYTYGLTRSASSGDLFDAGLAFLYRF